MRRIPVVKAKANFSRLLTEVEAGQEVWIARRGIAVAKISGVAPKKIRSLMKSIAAFRAGIALAKPVASELIRRVRVEHY